MPEKGARFSRLASRAASGVAAAAGGFCLVVALLLVVNWVVSRRAQPLDSRVMQSLRADLRKDAGNRDLQEEIRILDLLARRAYFTSVSFARTGAFLLMGGAVIFFLALRVQAALAREKSVPGAEWAEESADQKSLARRWVAGTALAIAAGCVLALLFFRGPPGAGGAGARWEERFRQWPCFRGPDGLARAGGGGFPHAWDGATGRNVRWKTPVPRQGFGSPVVWRDRVFLTGGDEAVREVYCYDAMTGDLLWRREVGGFPGSPAFPPQVTRDTGYAASTPATDGLRIFAVFSTGDLAAFDFAGKMLWGLNLGVPDNPYGHASSLMVWKDLLLVQYDQRDRARVLALRTATGETAWERTREVTVCWSSPILIPGERGAELVLSGNPFVVAYDPRTGDELWKISCLGGELASSPAYSENLVFTANQGVRLSAIRPGEKPEVAWEWSGDLPDVSSPLPAGDGLLVATGYGVVTFLDLAAGKVLGRKDFPHGFYASPILAEGRVHLMDRSGTMRILEPHASLRSLGDPSLGEPSSSTPAFAGSRIYLRGERHLFCVGGVGTVPEGG